MKYFDTYTSNSLTPAANQHYFVPSDPEGVCTARAFYRVFAGGRQNYSFLFSNILDSTYSDGSVGHMNLVCDEWEILAASVGAVDFCGMSEMPEPGELTPLTFGGREQKTVAPGEFFSTDAIELSPRAGQYICLELSFRGRMLPYHEEHMIPIFVKGEGGWCATNKMPLACMMGCDRPVDCRIGFIGDSITQGLGTPPNSFTHYAAVVADILGEGYSYWDLGIGFARANDAATDSAWLFKAKQVDVITVCLGVNDIFHGRTAEGTIEALETVFTRLRQAGVKVILQTVPPFDYPPEARVKWEKVNSHIVNEMAPRADGFFDVRPILSKSEDEPHMAKFGGHPNAEGHALWGKALAEVVREVAEKTKR